MAVEWCVQKKSIKQKNSITYTKKKTKTKRTTKRNGKANSSIEMSMIRKNLNKSNNNNMQFSLVNLNDKMDYPSLYELCSISQYQLHNNINSN